VDPFTEYDMQKRMADLVKEIDPIVSSAEVQRIVYTAEKRTLLNSRRLENTLAECLRNAEEIRDGVASLDNERGAVTRLFEHLQATYAVLRRFMRRHGALFYVLLAFFVFWAAGPDYRRMRGTLVERREGESNRKEILKRLGRKNRRVEF
jgi:hypothetical protein